jgi:hypothetical protein
VTAPSLFEVFQKVDAYASATTGDHRHRYLFEDVPFGAVPLQSLARLRGVATPTLDRLVGQAILRTGLDGRVLEMNPDRADARRCPSCHGTGSGLYNALSASPFCEVCGGIGTLPPGVEPRCQGR